MEIKRELLEHILQFISQNTDDADEIIYEQWNNVNPVGELKRKLKNN